MIMQTLRTPAQIKAAVHYERARADRTRGTFSLVTFRMMCDNRWDQAFHAWQLARMLTTRVRTTDEVGWFDGQAMCALLTDTAAAGAERFARDVVSSLEPDMPPLQTTIHTYPSTPSTAVIHDGGQRPQKTEARPLPIAEAWHGNGNGNGEAKASMNGVRVPSQGHRIQEQPEGSVQHLAHWLPQPLPLWKRLIDIVGATTGLVLLLPVLALTALAVRFTSPGPVLFRQWRSGIGGRPFIIYKFRTMVADAEARKQDLAPLNEQNGPAFKVRNDPRITSIGGFLRRTSLDELPQLWNVLKGDMTLVGPRPLPCAETDACEQWHRQRLDITPGITCIWQVEGRSRVSFDEWARMDIRYGRRRTIFHDMKILAQTVVTVLWTRNGM